MSAGLTTLSGAIGAVGTMLAVLVPLIREQGRTCGVRSRQGDGLGEKLTRCAATWPAMLSLRAGHRRGAS